MESADPGRAVLEDLARVALPELAESSRQPDPAEPASPPEGEQADARGWVGAAEAAPTPSTHVADPTAQVVIQ